MHLPDIDISKGELRDATRLAFQSALAAAIMFSLMKATGMPERFIGVLSAVMVIQPTAGAAMSEAKDRFVSTVVGAAIGFACLTLMPSGYGTAAALALSMLAINFVAGFKSEWRYGTVAAVALALGSDSDVMQTAIDRSLAIGVGVVIGTLVSLIVWRESSEKRAMRHLRRAMNALADYVDQAIDRVGDKDKSDKDARRNYDENISAARDASSSIHMNDSAFYDDQIDNVDQIWGAARFINRIGKEDDSFGEELIDKIDAIKKNSCKVLTALGNEESPESGTLNEIDKDVKEARAVALGGEGEGNFHHAAKGALIFTLGQLADALRDLTEEMSNRQHAH
ncbi:hypothetical protein G7A66_02550 [Altererythrobacter sp. SALINAS58]|uniref:FUSC family protein n=1 Tax=Alteripontixanthobacter muriae TaxID=2705546 RepID=UPI00157693DD|nr:FUSC family protein [Alteripontixanthobacter muriae]NTZ41990.1 hypothetical protein [Alteripontixanthobacter muriae]